MSDSDNEKILGWIILAGLGVMILIIILQALTIIFMFLTIISILATLIFLGFGFFSDDFDKEDYFLYAGIAFLCIILFFSAGRVTYSVSEVLQNNELTKGLMEITSAFFFIQEQKQEAINQLENIQNQALDNLTEEINNLNKNG